MKGFIFAAASLWELCLCFWLHTGIFPELSSWLPSALILCNIPLTRQRRQRGRCQILILLLHKTFSRWSPHSAFWWLPQSLPGPRSSDAHRSDCINMPIVCIPLCSGPVSSAGDGSSCDLSPVFRISDTSVLRVREYSVFTGQTLADCKLVKLTKLKFFSTLKTIPICHLSLSRINLRIQLSEWHHIAFNSSFFSTSSYFYNSRISNIQSNEFLIWSNFREFK